MAIEAQESSERLRQYLQHLSAPVRSRLLAELERLRLLGEDIPHADDLIALLRAEFRKTGQTNYRIGNPSRFFFEPLEPVLVDRAPECANCGQIARGSLAPIWSLATEKLLSNAANEYIASSAKVIAANRQTEARQMATAFRNKAVALIERMLEANDGIADLRAGLMAYTSSQSTFDDLAKMIRLLRGWEDLAEFDRALPAKIVQLEGSQFEKVLALLTAMRRKRPDIVPFAMTMLARHLEVPWQLLHLATLPAGSKAVAKIEATAFAIAVPMVIDQIEEKRPMLIHAIKQNSIVKAKEILLQIYSIEAALREQIALPGSDWGRQLHKIAAAVDDAMDAEIRSLPLESGHSMHVLQSLRLHKSHSSKKGRPFQRFASIFSSNA